MRRTLIALACLAAASCASKAADEVPVTPISAPSVQVSPSDDGRIAEQQTVINELLDRIEVMNARIQRLESGAPAQVTERVAEAPAPAGGVVRASAPPVAETSPSPEMAADGSGTTASRLAGAELADHYRAALALYGKGRFQDARQAFQQVFASDPNGELADNALYWIGETYYATGKYTEAVKVYRRIAEEFGDQNKAPDAMLKIGLSYEKSGDLGLARRAFQELVTRYPYSSPAATAKLEMKRIKY
ncbi:MAG TPA: tol-pal system protein YbgF [Thermoanaerobaculia bacterium]|nr:tol-pal system protein YbgF [Thermoanaerobaculia bacterium]